jgi:flagellum-specific peptidoglycan hydrolase FlgJ
MKHAKAIDLGPRLAMKRFHKERPKKTSVWLILLLSNAVWIFCAALLWGGLWSSTQLGVTLTDFYLEERARWFAVNQKQKDELQTRNVEIARMVAFQTSSPGDVVRLAETVSLVLDTAQGSKRDFLEKALPEAIRLQVQTGVPASAILSMSIYESGYGQSALAKDYNNFFGIKAFSGWKGSRAKAMPTVDSGVRTRADFRAYGNVYDGFKGYADYLRETGRYEKAFEQHTGEDFVQAVLRAGYCPDGDYHSNIRTIMARHNLTSLDHIITAGTEEKAPYQVAWTRSTPKEEPKPEAP